MTDLIRLSRKIGPTVSNIDIPHSKIHEGFHYICTHITTGINIVTPKRYLLIAPVRLTTSRAEIHFAFTMETQPGAMVEIFEGPTTTDNGTALSTFNNDRGNVVTTTPKLLIYRDPTVTVDGTLIFSQRSGTTTVGGFFGLITSREEEFILGTMVAPTIRKYQIKITPLADSTASSIRIDWYEIPKWAYFF